MILNEKLKAFATRDEFNDKRIIYKAFFKELISVRKKNLKKDPFSLISLNWDTIPEYFISSICKRKEFSDVRIDYTCYDYGYNNPEHNPSIFLKERKYYNVKIQKLHGSLNWGYCSSCGRLYVKYSDKKPPVFYEKGEATCEYCLNTKLKRLIITPTLVKDLNNTHLKMIWHNALMDLQQAQRIVFVGYSFPLADFEFRYMLTKAIASSASPHKKKIRVILYPPDDLLEKMPTSDQDRMRWERDAQERRYRNFFGHLDLGIKYRDAIDFMKTPKLIWNW